jgi:hypothetical protein
MHIRYAHVRIGSRCFIGIGLATMVIISSFGSLAHYCFRLVSRLVAGGYSLEGAVFCSTCIWIAGVRISN